MSKFHNYKKYRLPITINPLNYGKLIYQNINFYVMFINNRNLALIDQSDLYNQVKIYTNGELNFEYKDHKIDDSTFIRSIGNTKFSFKDNKLLSTEILARNSYYMIYKNTNNISLTSSSSILNNRRHYSYFPSHTFYFPFLKINFAKI
jgi:hypothetical protein